MDFMIIAPGTLEAVIFVCIALLVGLGAFVALT